LPITLAFFGILVALAVLGLITSRFVNVNRFSLHGMYRNRLVRAYLGASNCAIDGKQQRNPDPFTGFALNDNFPLHSLCDPPTPSNHRPGRANFRQGRPGCRARASEVQGSASSVHHQHHSESDARRKARVAAAQSRILFHDSLFCGNWKKAIAAPTSMADRTELPSAPP